MIKILIVAHGRFASGIKSSLNVLLGNSDNVVAIDAYVDDFDVVKDVQKYFELANGDDQIIMMTDLYGGSVNQLLYQYIKRPNTILLSGINLPLVLEIAFDKINDLSLERVECLIEESRKALLVVKDREISSVISDEDFF